MIDSQTEEGKNAIAFEVESGDGDVLEQTRVLLSEAHFDPETVNRIVVRVEMSDDAETRRPILEEAAAESRDGTVRLETDGSDHAVDVSMPADRSEDTAGTEAADAAEGKSTDADLHIGPTIDEGVDPGTPFATVLRTLDRETWLTPRELRAALANHWELDLDDDEVATYLSRAYADRGLIDRRAALDDDQADFAYRLNVSGRRALEKGRHRDATTEAEGEDTGPEDSTADADEGE